jgi:hypothetical protein
MVLLLVVPLLYRCFSQELRAKAAVLFLSLLLLPVAYWLLPLPKTKAGLRLKSGLGCFLLPFN